MQNNKSYGFADWEKGDIFEECYGWYFRLSEVYVFIIVQCAVVCYNEALKNVA